MLVVSIKWNRVNHAVAMATVLAPRHSDFTDLDMHSDSTPETFEKSVPR
jgi:hypothetical protein